MMVWDFGVVLGIHLVRLGVVADLEYHVFHCSKSTTHMGHQ